jgi:protoporphyrinogen/coproporphyrinogen III oxidase
MKRIAIIGGGLSGLSAAYQLTQERVEFTLFEASSRLGGIVETVHLDGFVIECGPDSWITEKPSARELAIELGLESELIGSNDRLRRTYLLDGKRLVPMPDGMRMMVPTEWAPVLNSSLFSWQAKLAFLREYRQADQLRLSALPEGKDESVASFVRRHFGDEVTHTIAGPLLAGVFGGSIETLSALAVMPAFVKLEQKYGSLIAGLQQRQSRSSDSIFTSLKSGLETLVRRMRQRLPSDAVRLGEAVHSVSHQNGQWQVKANDVTGPFDALIIATPGHVTRKLLAGVHEEFQPLLDMDATSAIVVAMAFSAEPARRMRIPRGFGYIVPQRLSPRPVDDPPLLACTFVDQKFSDRAPEGTVLLRAFFGGDTAPALLALSDPALIELACRQLSLTLGSLPEPNIALVRRWPLSLPQYGVGHLDRMSRLFDLACNFSGLHLIGNAYHGVGLPDMVRQGRDAARHVAKS